MVLLRVVFDTNVYISAALHGHEAETVLELASAHRIILLTSPAILSELEEKVRNKLGWSQERVTLFLKIIRDIVEIVEPQITLQVVEADEDDNRILECAVTGNASLIVTFDKDLLRLKSYETTGIITPRQLQFYGLEGR
ncbi:putative toxin-antitoxin system toxin component, PIN family [bacterium]|nr:putative toxin-antitoxin system toxin component, PIN family [bacterium]OIO88011.1 MAG: putative toxin-antitoxin system toxin component, PIN family [Anaerolineae bacterium CG2_30_58_95]PIX47364.1 MAG: putative toxin-antitoxin system toxin component, PIN family [Anaerolineae bacterium CG_4_8_14_3_um_filter_59_70]PJH74560.1 MAG: putative toxin-antitoxin system toxin component, PIN family [Anaerolineae bacterium CG_4_9_14_0_8_um_filter_58_9]